MNIQLNNVANFCITTFCNSEPSFNIIQSLNKTVTSKLWRCNGCILHLCRRAAVLCRSCQLSSSRGGLVRWSTHFLHCSLSYIQVTDPKTSPVNDVCIHLPRGRNLSLDMHPTMMSFSRLSASVLNTCVQLVWCRSAKTCDQKCAPQSRKWQLIGMS